MLDLLVAAAAAAAPASPAPAPRPITLAEAVDLARTNALIVVQAEGQSSTSAAAVRVAYAAFVPGVSVSAGATRQVPAGGSRTQVQNGQVVILPAEPWSYNIGWGANVDLFTGGARIFNLKQARARAGAADVNLEIARYAATLAAKQQYFNVLAARESESAADAQIEQAEQQLHASILRLRAQTVTRSDSLRSEIQLRNARLAKVDARVALEVGEASLTRAVGTTYPVTAATGDSLELPGLALDEATIRSLAEHGPAVEQAEAGLKAARAAVSSAWTGYLPTVTAGYSRTGSGISTAFEPGGAAYDYTGSLRLALSFPVFNQYQREEQLTQARVAESSAEAALADARLAAGEGLATSLGAFHSAEERVASQIATVEAAEEDLRVQQQRYAVGGSTLIDVLTSQATLDSGRQALIRARYDQRVAKAELEALVGRDL